MKSRIRLIQAVVFEWFDGPVEAMAVESDASSYLLKMIGDPPITHESLYRVSLLSPGAFQRALDLLEGYFGPARAPVWIPTWDIAESESRAVESALEALLAPAQQRVGYCQPSRTISEMIEMGEVLDVVWVDANRTQELDALAGDALWRRVIDLSDQESDSS